VRSLASVWTVPITGRGIGRAAVEFLTPPNAERPAILLAARSNFRFWESPHEVRQQFCGCNPDNNDENLSDRHLPVISSLLHRAGSAKVPLLPCLGSGGSYEQRTSCRVSAHVGGSHDRYQPCVGVAGRFEPPPDAQS
jgi:hypothetical protein